MKNWLGWRHRLASALVLIGMRDRLRCPACGAVGTWKPHGDPWFDRRDTKRLRRWLCKWCGAYVGPEGVEPCVPDAATRCWQLKKDALHALPTPAEMVGRAGFRDFPAEGDGPVMRVAVWPWAG